MSKIRIVSLWILTIVVVFGSALASSWQFERHYDRAEKSRQTNQVLSRTTLTNLTPSDLIEYWQPVSFEGRFLAETKLIRNRPLEGRNGFWVIDTLETTNGHRLAVLVGWIPSEGSATEYVRPPVFKNQSNNVTGIARAFELKKFADDLPTDQLLTFDATSLSSDFDYFVQVEMISPELNKQIAFVPVPRFSQGPHFFYAIQWIIFGLIAIAGTIYLTKTESSNVKT